MKKRTSLLNLLNYINKTFSTFSSLKLTRRSKLVTSKHAKSSKLKSNHARIKINIPINNEIKELLGSKEWDEVNQGLELLATINLDLIDKITKFVDISNISFSDFDEITQKLGISSTHSVNAIFKLFSLNNLLEQVKSICINHFLFENGIQADLSLIQGAVNLESLIINLDQYNDNEITGLESISCLKNIQHLVINLSAIDLDSDAIKKVFFPLKNLETLVISNWPFSDLSLLSNCKSIKELFIKSGELETLQGISSFKDLSRLSLCNCNSLTSLDTLHYCTKVKHLSIADVSNFDLQTIFHLSELERIDFVNVSMDLLGIDSCKKLSCVNLEGIDYINIGALATCNRLSRLKIDNYYEFKLVSHNKNKSISIRNLDKFDLLWASISSRSTTSLRNRSQRLTFSEGTDIYLSLLKINIIEFLTGHIDMEAYSNRVSPLYMKLSKRSKRSIGKTFTNLDSIGNLPPSSPIKILINYLQMEVTREKELIKVMKDIIKYDSD